MTETITWRPDVDTPQMPQVRAVEDVVVRRKFGPKNNISWVCGSRVEGDEFVGKRDVVAEAMKLVMENHSVGIVGGPGTGKSSVVERMLEELKIKGGIRGVSKVILSSSSEDDAVRNVEEIRAKSGKRGKIAIALDGEAWEIDETSNILEYLATQKDLGHYVVMAIYGDYRFHPGISDTIREACGNLIGDSIVVNRLMTDEEIKKKLLFKGRPVFTPEVENYIVLQSGGHPYLASMLAGEVFRVIRRFKFKEGLIEWPRFWKDVFKVVKEQMGGLGGDLGRSLRYVKEAGFDPRTWEFSGDPRISQDVYRNMLPRNRSTIFQEWLNELESN